MNCWLIFFLLICGGNQGGSCGRRMNSNCDCNRIGCGNDCMEERREECCETRRDECCEVHREQCCRERQEERREERRDNRRDGRKDCDCCDNDNRYEMNTPPWARAGERDRDDSCGCQNR